MYPKPLRELRRSTRSSVQPTLGSALGRYPSRHWLVRTAACFRLCSLHGRPALSARTSRRRQACPTQSSSTPPAAASPTSPLRSPTPTQCSHGKELRCRAQHRGRLVSASCKAFALTVLTLGLVTQHCCGSATAFGCTGRQLRRGQWRHSAPRRFGHLRCETKAQRNALLTP